MLGFDDNEWNPECFYFVFLSYIILKLLSVIADERAAKTEAAVWIDAAKPHSTPAFRTQPGAVILRHAS